MADFAVIFDSDGVIVDSEHISLETFQQALREQGVTLSDEDIMANCGLTDEDIIKYVRQKLGMEVESGLFQKRKQELYEECVKAHGIKAFNGAIELLDTLKNAGISYALASSGSMKKINLNLGTIGILDKFPIIISGEDMERGKPHPDIFLAAAKALDTPPERCVVFEDSLNGIEAAHRAGMKCIAVAGTFPPEKLDHADFIVESLYDVNVSTLQNLLSE